MILSYIVPKTYNIIQATEEATNNPDIHLLLAHNFIQNFQEVKEISNAEIVYDSEYVDYWRYTNQYKILDNSAFEFGSALDIKRLVEIALAINAQELVLPDVLFNKVETIRIVKEAIAYLERRGLIGRFKLMAVVHGVTKEKWIDCYKQYLDLPIDVIGISKAVQDFNPDKRNGFVRELMSMGLIDEDREIHFLGLVNNLTEIVETPRCVRSLDSSAMWLQAKYDLGIKPNTCRPVETIDFNEDFDKEAWLRFIELYLPHYVLLLDKKDVFEQVARWIGKYATNKLELLVADAKLIVDEEI